MNNRLTEILDWSQFIKLSFNHSKSEFIINSNRRIETDPQIIIRYDPVDPLDMTHDPEPESSFQANIGQLLCIEFFFYRANRESFNQMCILSIDIFSFIYHFKLYALKPSCSHGLAKILVIKSHRKYCIFISSVR